MYICLVELETLYNMVKAAALSAERALRLSGGQNYSCSGYPAYVEKYNDLIKLTVDIFGKETEKLFPPINLFGDTDPQNVFKFGRGDYMWRTYLERAALKLNELEAYLRSKLGLSEKQIEIMLDFIDSQLRKSVSQKPETEGDIQNVLTILFNARFQGYQHEQVRIEYSGRDFIPDFTFDFLDLIVEVKFCNSDKKRSIIIEEINADIPAYQSRYTYIIFVVYDLEFISDVKKFKAGIEGNPNVHVLVIKH